VVVKPQVSASISLTNPVQCNNDCNASLTALPSNGVTPFTFLWSNSQTTAAISGLCAGIYTVTITDSLNCSATQTFTIPNPPPLTISASATDDYCGRLCIGSAFVSAGGGVGPFTYQWNDPQNQSTAFIQSLCEGNYSVTVTDANGCTITANAFVGYTDYFPPFNAVPPEATIYQGQSINITSTIYPGGVYQWSPPDGLNNVNISNPVATPVQTIVYVVQFADSNGCPNADTVKIFIKETTCVEPEIFIPNAFSPNDDGSNDILYVRGNTIRELMLRVYNRWGEKVFETNSPSSGWNGTYKGARVQPGVYDYYLEATCVNNEKFFKKGNITVLR